MNLEKELKDYIKNFIKKQDADINTIKDRLSKLRGCELLLQKDIDLLSTKYEQDIQKIEVNKRYANELLEFVSNNSNAMLNGINKNDFFLIVYGYIKKRIFEDSKLDNKHKKDYLKAIKSAYNTVKPFLNIDNGFTAPKDISTIRKEFWESFLNAGYSKDITDNAAKYIFDIQRKPTGAQPPTEEQDIRLYDDGIIKTKTKTTFTIKTKLH